jgi:hypothetical protein
MTETKYNQLVSKIFWFTLPLMISLLTYLVVESFAIKESMTRIATSHESDMEMDAKMWSLIQENNTILHSKADAESNEKEHYLIINKLDRLENSVDKVYKQYSFSYIGPDQDFTYIEPKQDTTFYIAPYKNMSFITKDESIH